MPRVLNVFPLTLFQDRVEVSDADRQQMVAAILEMGEQKLYQTPGSTWTGDVNGFEFLHNDPRFSVLFDKFAGPLRNYLKTLCLDPDLLELYYTRSWGTISRRGEATTAHIHEQSHISLVYYLRKPEGSSGISFLDNDAPNQFAPKIFHERMLRHGLLKEIQALNAVKAFMETKQDDVVIFPSKTLHAIVPNTTDEPRLSIAVDIVVTVKDSQGLEFLYPNLGTWKVVA